MISLISIFRAYVTVLITTYSKNEIQQHFIKEK